MQLLEERNKTDSAVGKLSFSILLMQDIAIVPILTMLTAFSAGAGGNIAVMILKAVLISALSVLLIYLIGSRILQPVLKYLNPSGQSEWLMSFTLFIVIGTAMLTESIGLSPALGAFLAGLLLAETGYKDNIRAMISPMKGFLLGVFFLSVGMMIDLGEVLDNPLWVFLSVIGVGILKAVILFGLCLLFKFEADVSAETAIILGQSGEFVFVIAAMALANRIISIPDAQFFMLVTALSMMITPFVSLAAPGAANWISHRMGGLK